MPDRRLRNARPTGLRRALAWGIAAYAVALILFTALRLAIPIRTGPLALLQVVEPHLLLLLAVLALPVAWARLRTPAAIVGIALLAGLARNGSEWVSFPVTGSDDDLVVLTWNLEIGSRPVGETVAALVASDADVIALQELTPDVAEAIEADDELALRYPYRTLVPADGFTGMGILSRHRISEPNIGQEPARIDAVIESPAGEIRMINAHPQPARLRLPFTFDTARRDGKLATLREEASAAIRRGERLLLIGDFNVTPDEPGYGALADGLRDLHTDVGIGPGWTWRPGLFEGLGLALVRIDHVLLGPGLDPVAAGVECSLPGDHCRVTGRIAVR